MISDKQTEANRLNAQKSTGPTTDAGKAISSQNAFKSGLYAQSMIIPGERLEDFQALSSEYYERCQPATPEERACVDLAIRHEWFLRRYTNVECQFWIFGIKGQIRERPGFELGYVFNDQSQQFARAAAHGERHAKIALRRHPRARALAEGPARRFATR